MVHNCIKEKKRLLSKKNNRNSNAIDTDKTLELNFEFTKKSEQSLGANISTNTSITPVF
jgi:hypothetical protein